MKLALQIVSWFSIVIGGFAILGSVSPYEPYGIVGGIMFLGQGAVALAYLESEKK